jgi:hypothetical protein
MKPLEPVQRARPLVGPEHHTKRQTTTGRFHASQDDRLAMLALVLSRYHLAQCDDDYNDDLMGALLNDLERVSRAHDPTERYRRLPEDRHGEEALRPWESGENVS